MKKLLVILLTFLTVLSYAQDLKPVDENLKILQAPNSPIFYYNVGDSTIGLWKGIYKYNKLFSAKQTQHKVDSLAFVVRSIYPATGLTTGYIPYKTSTVLANSPISTDGTNVGMGVSPTVKLDVVGQAKINAAASGQHATFQMENEGTSRHNQFNFKLATNSTDFKNSFQALKSYGTIASPTSVAANDQVFSIIGVPYRNSGYRYTSSIDFLTGSTFSDTDYSMAIRFMTAKTGETTRSERARIHSNGYFGVWTDAPTVPLDVNGAAKATSLALGGATIGTNAFAATGTGEISGLMSMNGGFYSSGSGLMSLDSKLYFGNPAANEGFNFYYDTGVFYLKDNAASPASILTFNESTKAATFYGTINYTDATVSTIAGFDASENLVSLTTDTYPTLAQLSYVKGVTSSIQTQINNIAVPITTVPQALSGTTPTWNTANGINATITLSGNTTITLSNIASGQTGNISVQSAATAYTLDVSGYTNVISKSVGTIGNYTRLNTTGASGFDVFSYYYDGTVLIWNGNLAYIKE